MSTVIPPVIPATIPPAPAGLLPWQQREIIHSGELAIANSLSLVARGVCILPGHAGAPVFCVNSLSRPGRSHLVWVEGGRIHCDCEARTVGHRFTCTHAQFVRLLIVAEHAERRSAPAAVAAPSPEEPEDDEPTPPPSGPDGGPSHPSHSGNTRPCPTCAEATDEDELDQLGECLHCLQMHADEVEEARRAEEAQQLPCWACGAPATAETDHGLYCDECVSLPAATLRHKVRARRAEEVTAATRQKIAARAEERGARATELAANASHPAVADALTRRAETARRVIAREKAREKAHTPSEASASARRTRAAKTSTKTSTKTPAKDAAVTVETAQPWQRAIASNGANAATDPFNSANYRR